MKGKEIILAIAVCAICHGAMGANHPDLFATTKKPETNAITATIQKKSNAAKKSVHIQPGKPKPASPKINHAGGISSRPWTKIVGWHSAAPLSARENAEIHEPQLTLVTVWF